LPYKCAVAAAGRKVRIAYTDESVRRSIEAGAKVIEHGQLMTDETAKLAAEKGVWLSTQIAFLGEEPTPEQIRAFGEVTAAKFRMVREGVETSIGVVPGWGSCRNRTRAWLRGHRIPQQAGGFKVLRGSSPVPD